MKLVTIAYAGIELVCKD